MDSNKSDTDQINTEPQIPPDDMVDSTNRERLDVEAGECDVALEGDEAYIDLPDSQN